jgi:hypothetical protein
MIFRISLFFLKGYPTAGGAVKGGGAPFGGAELAEAEKPRHGCLPDFVQAADLFVDKGSEGLLPADTGK